MHSLEWQCRIVTLRSISLRKEFRRLAVSMHHVQSFPNSKLYLPQLQTIEKANIN